MPKGRTRSASITGGDLQRSGDHVANIREMFLAALRSRAGDVVAELRDVHSVADVSAWAKRTHLDAPWVRLVAMRTITRWAASMGEREHLIVASAITDGQLVPEPSQPPAWAPTIETEAEFRGAIDAYIAQVKTWANSMGLVSAVERRQLVRDIDAFISYQVREWDFAAVVDEYFEGSSDDAARKALRQISDDLQIPLRK